MKQKNRDIFIKKLLHKSCYRGCKETDLIIGNFARNNIREMSDQELEEFANILEILDADIYDWFTRKKPIPEEYQSPLLSKLMNYNLHK